MGIVGGTKTSLWPDPPWPREQVHYLGPSKHGLKRQLSVYSAWSWLSKDNEIKVDLFFNDKKCSMLFSQNQGVGMLPTGLWPGDSSDSVILEGISKTGKQVLRLQDLKESDAESKPVPRLRRKPRSRTQSRR